VNDSRRQIARLVATIAGCAMLVACQGLSPPQTSGPPQSATAPAGGTLRIVMPRDVSETNSTVIFPAPDPDEDGYAPATLDPHLAPWGDSAELLRCCLARSLLSTNGRSADEQGAVLRPDLAAALPAVSGDGLSWTFELKAGLHYGPPLESVEITSADFVRSFERMLSPELVEAGAYEADLFRDIVGAAPYIEGKATSIAGIETPDSHTIVVRLERPAGDLGARLANPWAAPIPPNPFRPEARYGVADGHEDGYGPFMVSSGPYMIDGSPNLDFRLPADRQPPATGLQPGVSLALVRNPAWAAASDQLRPAHPERIEIHATASVETGAAEIEAGRADLLVNQVIAPSIPADILHRFDDDPGRGRAYVNEYDGLRGVTMNTAQPPFDDLHVRKAVAYVINRARLVELQGGSSAYRVARHLAPEVLLNNLLVDYRPYMTPQDMGDIEAAQTEMRQSAYDSDGDGVCDAAACHDVLSLSRQSLASVGEAVAGDLARIGIQLRNEALETGEYFDAANDPSRHVAMFASIGWAKDYISASNFFISRFYSPAALTAETGNITLVGASAEQLAAWGYEPVEVPNVDQRIEACIPLVGTAQFECWAGFDQYMMENVAAVLPFSSELVTVIAAPSVKQYAFDQVFSMSAFDQIELAQ
jgi:peptide/nickel transport system substrate-binding protein